MSMVHGIKSDMTLDEKPVGLPRELFSAGSRYEIEDARECGPKVTSRLHLNFPQSVSESLGHNPATQTKSPTLWLFDSRRDHIRLLQIYQRVRLLQ